MKLKSETLFIIAGFSCILLWILHGDDAALILGLFWFLYARLNTIENIITQNNETNSGRNGSE